MTSDIPPASDSGDYFTDTAMPTLLPQHKKLLDDSAISTEVRVARGYRSVRTKAELKRLGFSDAQSGVKYALVMPAYRPNGEPGIVQMRPDEPRIFADGKRAKYEMPQKERMCLDVPPTVRKYIRDPKVPLFITEGIRKADSLASIGVCTIGLMGVTCWKGTNEEGGKTTLPDWDDVALNRDIYICFDSDVMTKRSVFYALASFREWLLEKKGSTVYLIYLPYGEAGAKVGVDDYLAAGHTLDDLLRLATPELRLPPESEEDKPRLRYRETYQGLFYDKPMGDGNKIPVQLTNFTARILAEVKIDDGVDVVRHYRVEARRKDSIRSFNVLARRFDMLEWISDELSSGAYVLPGPALRDHARAAIREISQYPEEPPEEHVYSHTGWREIGGRWVYLHGGGGIGGGGGGVTVDLPRALRMFTLPEVPEGEDRKRSVEAALSLLDPAFAPEAITFPLLAGVFRAALDGADFSLALIGRSGAFKSEMAALVQRFFAPEMDREHLVGSWSSTDNSIEEMAFLIKDALFVVDDFVPKGANAEKLHNKAERVLRAQGNGSGRQRMRQDLSMPPARPPRGIILLTGEEAPRGQSLQARMLILDIQEGDVKPDPLQQRQMQASAGLYSQALAAFLAWIAPCYPTALASLRENALHFRKQAQLDETMRRTPGIVGNLFAAFDLFLEFVVACKVRTKEEAEELRGRAWQALLAAARSQVGHQGASEPTRIYVDMLREAIASGRAHLADSKGFHPDAPEAWGWRSKVIGAGEHERQEWQPQGKRVGYVEDEHVYLLPSAALSEAKDLSRDHGEELTLSVVAMGKRLREAKLLVSIDAASTTLLIRRKLEGKTAHVLHFAAKTFLD